MMSPARSTPSACLRSLWKTATPAARSGPNKFALDMGLGLLAEGAGRGAEVEQGRDLALGQQDFPEPDRLGLEHGRQSSHAPDAFVKGVAQGGTHYSLKNWGQPLPSNPPMTQADAGGGRKKGTAPIERQAASARPCAFSIIFQFSMVIAPVYSRCISSVRTSIIWQSSAKISITPKMPPRLRYLAAKP